MAQDQLQGNTSKGNAEEKTYLTFPKKSRNVSVVEDLSLLGLKRKFSSYFAEIRFIKVHSQADLRLQASEKAHNRRERYKIFILIFTFCIYASYHLSRKPISIVKTVLHRNCSDNGTVPTQAPGTCSWPPFQHDNYQELLGSLDYAYLFAYAVGMFASGHIAERMNLRYFLGTGMVLSGIFTALFGMARYWNIHSLPYFLAMQVMGGVVQSSGWPSVVTCVANWFGKGRRGLIMGVWNSHTSVGNILGSLIAGAFVEDNWGLSFIVPGAIIFGLGIMVFLFLVPKPEDVGCALPDEAPKVKRATVEPSPVEVLENVGEEEEPLLAPEPIVAPAQSVKAISFLGAMKIPGVIEFSFCLFFAKLVSYTFLYWLPNYIRVSTHFGPEQSADISTLFDIGGIAGGIIAGVISDYSGARALTCAVMLVIAAPMLFVYQHFGAIVSMTGNILLLVTCGLFVNGPYALITTAVSADLGTHKSLRGNAKALSTVTAIIDGTGSMGAALGPLLTGLLSPYGWDHVFYMLIAADGFALLLLARLVYKEIQGFRNTRTNAIEV